MNIVKIRGRDPVLRSVMLYECILRERFKHYKQCECYGGDCPLH